MSEMRWLSAWMETINGEKHGGSVTFCTRSFPALSTLSWDVVIRLLWKLPLGQLLRDMSIQPASAALYYSSWIAVSH